jgi:signal transduction histidine kinase
VIRKFGLRLERGLLPVLSAGITVSVVALAWFGYVGNRQWERSVAALAERRAAETADLLTLALGRDMRGVQSTVLESSEWEAYAADDSVDVRNLAASALARFPYPECFVAWRLSGPRSEAVFPARSDRRPSWITPDRGALEFPVVTGASPSVARRLADRVGADIARGKPYSTFEITIDNERHQAIARVIYRDRFRQQPAGVAGFLVNLEWVRRHYFPEMAGQVLRLGGKPRVVPATILDDHGTVVTGPRPSSAVTISRSFPLLFSDPRLAAIDPPDDLQRVDWTVVVDVANDPTLALAVRNADRSLAVSAFAVGGLGLGLLLTARAIRGHARVAQMRSDFVSTVTHELKTPIATIRAAGDTLAHGRVADPGKQRAYASLVVREAKRLARLVDNILAWARVNDEGDVYSFGRLDLQALVEETLREFDRPLADAGFDVEVAASDDLPLVRGDQTSLALVFSNLIDNAMRYSADRRSLRITLDANGPAVVAAVADRGCGIPAADLARVRRRWARGTNARASGSGLGLAIVERVVRDHQGTVTIQSEVGEGTTVSVRLPAAESTHEEADPGR